MTIGLNPVCLKCKHYHVSNFDGFTCDAFPEGIPDELFFKGEKHLKPLPEQGNNIVFEPIEKQNEKGTDN